MSNASWSVSVNTLLFIYCFLSEYWNTERYFFFTLLATVDSCKRCFIRLKLIKIISIPVSDRKGFQNSVYFLLHVQLKNILMLIMPKMILLSKVYECLHEVSLIYEPSSDCGIRSVTNPREQYYIPWIASNAVNGKKKSLLGFRVLSRETSKI